MTDVRKDLLHLMRHGGRETESYEGFVDAMLRRYDVTPKANISDEELGRLVAESANRRKHDVCGDVFRAKLGACGFMIVRVDDDSDSAWGAQP